MASMLFFDSLRRPLNAVRRLALGTLLCVAFAPVYAGEGDIPYAREAGQLKGIWQGGAPPINKRMSGINTYYRINSAEQPEQLEVLLHFEGAVASDAYVEIKAIDGAVIQAPAKHSRWKLKPGVASEISLLLQVPPHAPSYLALYTYQNGKSAARAIELKGQWRRSD